MSLLVMKYIRFSLPGIKIFHIILWDKDDRIFRLDNIYVTFGTES